MFAIIDIETCGGSFQYGRGRITEICILIHDGLSVVEKFATLVNPECYISPYFTQLTGITNEMVQDAPKFHEIARNILELTENRIFIAHNVNFDYGFIKAEFASLGFSFRRQTLCTVRLSRKLIPGRASYSLGRLCAALGIENNARHRAEGDAVATAQLFDILLRLKNEHPQYRNNGVDELMTRRIDKIKKYILDKIPEECGVYYFLDKEGNIIYIGKSTNMYNRAIAHFNTATKKSKQMLNDLYNADFVKTGSELVALLLESEEIKKHKPLYNRMRKAEEFSYSIDHFHDESGILSFRIVPHHEASNPLLSFNCYSSAREKLDNWIDENELCLKYCGLTSEDAVCFNHQIKKCRGICSGAEAKDDYNLRALKITRQFKFKDDDFVIFDRGRHQEEKSIVLIVNGHYRGYGYIDEFCQVNSHEELKDLISSCTFFPDANNLIKGWMNRNRPQIRVISQ